MRIGAILPLPEPLRGDGIMVFMALHVVEPTPESTVNFFSAAHEPVLTMDPGDTVIVRTLDAAGYLVRQQFPGDTGQPKMFPGDFRGHCLNQPIAVRGAAPGDMLAVRLVSVTPGDWGWTAAPAVPDSPVLKRLGLAGTEQAWLLWEIDADAGTATANGTYTRPLAPFLGVTGTAPAAPGEHSTIPPRAESGGNSDGHGAQGDGEVCGTAIECPMTTEAVVNLAAGRPLTSVHAETPAGRITFGFSADLNEAMGDALDAMVTWLASLYGTSRTEALALASNCVDLRVTQVANVTWGVHALLPAGLLSVG
jgi:acetamidase/formamidase